MDDGDRKTLASTRPATFFRLSECDSPMSSGISAARTAAGLRSISPSAAPDDRRTARLGPDPGTAIPFTPSFDPMAPT
jgi:hypothetical protein